MVIAAAEGITRSMGQVIDINELRRGNKIDIEGEPYQVVSVDFRKPGKGTPSTSVMRLPMAPPKTTK